MGKMAQQAADDMWENLYFDLLKQYEPQEITSSVNELQTTVTWQNHIPRMERMLAKHIKGKRFDKSISRDYLWMKLLDFFEKELNKPKPASYPDWWYGEGAGIEWWKD